MSMPGEIDIQSWDSHVAWVLCYDLEEDFIFPDQTVHGCLHCRRVKPIDVVHFLNKSPLSDDSTNQV